LKKENELAKLKLQQNEEINKQCTFQPNALQATKSPKTNPVEVSKKLYTDAKQRKAKKEKTEDEKKEKEKIPVDFSFKPTVHPVKDEVFQANPIQNDEDVKKKVERYERARIERKLCELQKNKGVNNFKNVSNIEEMIKKGEEHTPWKFGIDIKTYKDTFDIRKAQEKKDDTKNSTVINKSIHDKTKATFVNKNNDTQNNNVDQNNSNTFENEHPENTDEQNPETQENHNENYNNMEDHHEGGQEGHEGHVDTENHTENNTNLNTIPNNALLLAIDVNISEETSEKLEIYKNDDLDEVLEVFCNKHNLDSEKKNILRQLITDKLNENAA